MAGLRRAGAVAVVCCCLTLAVGWWSKARCLNDGRWTDSEQYLSWCYTDVFPLWNVERLDEGAIPYVEHPVEYPVLTGLQMWVTAQVAYVFPEALRSRAFFHTTAVLNALLSLTVLGLLASAGVPRIRLLWWALAPAVAVYAFLNWDPLAVVLMTAAVVLHLRGRDVASGVAAGLGVAAKLIPGVVIPFIVAARLAQGRRRDALAHLAAAAAAWLVVNVPVAVTAPDGWLRFLQLNRDRGANYDSLWYLAQRLRGVPFEVSTINAVSAILLLVGTAAIAVVGTRRRPPSDWWALALPVLCWFLITNKVYSPQYSLWILPLAAMSLRRFAPYIAFLLTDAMLFFVEFPFLGGLQGAQPAPSYDLFAIALVLRYAMLTWILVESTLDHDPSLTVMTVEAHPVAAEAPTRMARSG